MTTRKVRSVLGALRGDWWSLLSLLVICGLLAISLLAPVLAPYDPYEVDLKNRLEGPSREHPLGTDELGRDVLSRIMYGGIYTLGIALLAVALASVIGTLLGLVAGYYGGAADLGLMRLVDVMLAFPGIVLALVIAGLLGPSPENLADRKSVV